MQRLLSGIAVGMFVASSAFVHAQKTVDLKTGSGGSPHVRTEWTIDGANISIEYGRPFLKGRPEAQMMPPGREWRTGADVATIITSDKPLKFGAISLAPGSYTINTVPGDKEWQLVLGRLEQARPVGYSVSEGSRNRPHADDDRQDESACRERDDLDRRHAQGRGAARRMGHGVARRRRSPSDRHVQRRDAATPGSEVWLSDISAFSTLLLITVAVITNPQLWKSHRARITSARLLTIERQRTLAERLPRARRRRRARLRADRSRRREDARQNAVSRPPLEREDVSIRVNAVRLRWSAGSAASAGAANARSRDCRSGGDDHRSGSLHPELLRRGRTDGIAPGQGRRAANRLPRAFRLCRCRSATPRAFCSAGSSAAIPSTPLRSSRAMRSSSAGPRGCAITACRALLRARLRQSSDSRADST